MTTTPSKEAQVAEAAAREASGTPIPAGETAAATETVGDAASASPQPAPQKAQAAQEQQPPLPTVKSPFDDRRAEIVARFRTDRGAPAEGDTEQVTSFTQTNGLPPEFQEEPDPAVAQAEQAPAEGEEATPEPAAETAAEPAPAKHRVKVRGQEQELTTEELIAHAQKALAADNYLEEAKGKLSQVDALIRETQNRAARPAQDGIHPAAPSQTQQPDGQPAQAPGAEHPESPVRKLIETMQFGDPEEAEALFQNTLANMANGVVQQNLREARFKDEGARTAKVLTDFKVAHPEIANDSMASAALEANIHEQQRQDLIGIGIDPAKIRTDGLPPTPGDVADAHRWFRVEQGMNLKAPQQMLEKARDDFLEWKGVKKANPAAGTPSNPPKAAPRVDVSVDRQARRQAVAPQPSPATAQRPVAAPAPQPRNRSDVVQAMKQRNAQKRGQVAV